MKITLGNVVEAALNGRDRFEADNGHIIIKRGKDGKIYCCYDSMPGYAVAQARDRFFQVTDDMLGLEEYDLPPENRFAMQGVVLAALGLA